MGAYLSKPVTTKIPKDETNDFLEYGASTMQGWRLSQEDEHNCLLDFDKDTSMFAVYDGHGGAEVAKYTAEKLPDFLLNLEQYKDGNVKEALIESFLGFDATLTKDGPKEKLKELADLNFDEADEDEEQETAMLFEEADMPLDQLLQRYEGGSGDKNLKNAQKAALSKDKIMSPMIRAKRDGLKLTEQSNEDATTDIKDPLLNGHDKVSPVSEDPDNEAKAALPRNELKVDSESSVSEATVSSGKDTLSECKQENSSCKQETPECKDTADSQEGKSLVAQPAADSEVSCSSSGTGGAQSSGGGDADSVSSSSKPSSNIDGEQEGSVGSSAQVSSSVNEPSTNNTEAAGQASSSQEGEASSSSGRVRKKRQGVIPAEGEDESSFDEDEETTDEEGDSDDEDDEKYWESDSDSEDSEDDELDGEEGGGPFGASGDDNGEQEERVPFGEEPGFDSGCTAVVALFRGKTLYVANAGDSRCVLCRGGKAVDLSVDHKPEDAPEKTRIYKAGGRITADGRVNGGLNLSRAIGDHRYKQNDKVPFHEQMITSEPEVVTTTIEDQDEFVVLACDGIWNVMSSQDVIDFVRERILAGVYPLSDICGEMFDLCLAPDTKNDGTGCDNMTCIIVNFNPKRRSSEADAKVVEQPLSTKCQDSTQESSDGVDTTSGKRKADNEVDSDSTTPSSKKPKVDSSQVDSTDSG